MTGRETIGVVGAGTMGAGIAALAAEGGFEVILHDVSEEVLSKARERISADFAKRVDRKILSSERASEAAGRIRASASLDQLSRCGFVIESASEDLSVKRGIYLKLEPLCSPETVIATNTSSLSITSLASRLSRPGLFVGMHFFNPPGRMRLVEIIRGIKSSDAAVDAALDLSRRMGKEPVIAKDTPGFIVNRIARPFYGEALRILGEGIAAHDEIDRIVRLEGGFHMGPFELMDLIGIDVNLAVTKSIYEQTFGEPRYRPHIIQQGMVDSGKLGRKSGQGFYPYGR